MNMNDKKTKRIIAGVIAVIMALAMVEIGRAHV